MYIRQRRKSKYTAPASKFKVACAGNTAAHNFIMKQGDCEFSFRQCGRSDWEVNMSSQLNFFFKWSLSRKGFVTNEDEGNVRKQ